MTVAAARRRSETSPEDEAEILGTIDRWLDRDVRPHVQALEHDDTYPAEMYRR